MADKRNEILDEQRRARQEFLELKKMQHGEMEAPPKPSEVAIVPRTPKEKWDNFWFQYKWHVIAVTAAVVVLAVLITQCATRKKYDIEVVYFSYTAALDAQTEAMADYLSRYASDINGDGKVNVQVVNCSFTNNSGNAQYRNTMLTKLQSLIAADANALLFITDGEAYEYLSGVSNEGLFEGEGLSLGSDFYEKVKEQSGIELPEGLTISCRRVADTILEKKKETALAYESAQKLLSTLPAIKSIT